MRSATDLSDSSSEPTNRRMFRDVLPSEIANDFPSEWSRTYSGTVARRLEAVGSRIGCVVQRISQIPELVQRSTDVLYARAETIGEQAVESARYRGANLVNHVRERANTSKRQINRLAQEKPLHFIAGAAAIGAILGFALRMGNDHE